MKLALKFDVSNIKDNRELSALLHAATVHIVIAEEEKDLPKRIFKLLPDVIKSKIDSITSIKVGKKEYDATKSFAENDIINGSFVVLTVKAPVTEEQKQKEALKAATIAMKSAKAGPTK